MFVCFYSTPHAQANNDVAAVKNCVDDGNDEQQEKPLHRDTPVSITETVPDEKGDNRNAAFENRKSERADIVVEAN